MVRDDDADLAEAATARALYREVGIVPLPPDPAIEQLLGPCERLVARRYAVTVDRRRRGGAGRPCGDLYVTDQRLILLGPTTVSIVLDDIEDAALLGDSLVLALRGGADLTVNADRPRLLRVQLAAARAAREGSMRRAPRQPPPR